MSNFPFDKCVSSKAELERIIQQVKDYIKQIKYSSEKEYTELFRGQGRDCWKLIPKIARQIKQVELIEVTERNIIRDFYDLMSKEDLLDAINEGLHGGKFEKDWLRIQQAQLYGLPTRFLDWSGKWEAALCFAVADECDDNCQGHFWIYLVPED